MQGATGEVLAELCGVTFRTIPVPSALSSGTRVADTLFKLTWKAYALRSTVAHRGDRRWLICSRELGAGHAFAEVLRSAGARVDLLDVTDSEDPAWRLLSIANRSLPLTVVDLQALDWRNGSAKEDITNLQALCSFSARLTELAEGEVEIWTATRGAHEEFSPLPAQAGIWGLDRGLIRAEHSANWRGIVDLPINLREGWTTALRELIESNPQANEFKWESGSWQHSCLVRCPASPSVSLYGFVRMRAMWLPVALEPWAAPQRTTLWIAAHGILSCSVALHCRNAVLGSNVGGPSARSGGVGSRFERRGVQVLSSECGDGWMQQMEERGFPAGARHRPRRRRLPRSAVTSE